MKEVFRRDLHPLGGPHDRRRFEHTFYAGPMRLVRVEQIWPQHVWLDVTRQWGGDHTHPGLLTARGCDERGRWWGWVISARTHAGGGSVSVTEESGWHRAEHIRMADVVGPDG